MEKNLFFFLLLAEPDLFGWLRKIYPFQADSFIKWTAITAVVVGVGAMAIFSEPKEKKEKEQESMYCIKSRQSSRGEQESDEEEK